MQPPSRVELLTHWDCTNKGHKKYCPASNTPGVYVLCVLVHDWHEIFYIGTSSNVASRLDGHEKIRDLMKVFEPEDLYCFHKFVYYDTDRLTLERNMIEAFLPRLNKQHNYEHGY